MDPRTKWIRDASKIKKRKPKRRPAPKTIPLERTFWENVAQRRSYLNERKTEIYDNNHEFRIAEVLRKIRGVRDRNEVFRDELNEIMGIDIVQGAHNRQGRINRGNDILRHIRQNDDLMDELQIEINDISELYDDVTSTPRR